jgi:hypothetical protein
LVVGGDGVEALCRFSVPPSVQVSDLRRCETSVTEPPTCHAPVGLCPALRVLRGRACRAMHALLVQRFFGGRADATTTSTRPSRARGLQAPSWSLAAASATLAALSSFHWGGCRRGRADGAMPWIRFSAMTMHSTPTLPSLPASVLSRLATLETLVIGNSEPQLAPVGRLALLDVQLPVQFSMHAPS